MVKYPYLAHAYNEPFFCKGSNPDTAKLKEASSSIFSELQADLQKRLKESIEKGGIVSAIETCKTASPEIEAEFSKKYNVKIKRVSEKNRNPEHSPDAWEKTIFTEWNKAIAAGNSPFIATFSDSKVFRLMQPIKINNALCLQCHGTVESIKPDVLKKIQDLYPEDKATGYQLEELRGAFTIQWELK